MTRRDYLTKWLCYAAALLPALILEFSVFARWPLLGITPLLLPVCALCVATLEASVGGVGYGLFCALLWSAAVPGDRGGMILLLPRLCLLASLLSQRMLSRSLLGTLLCTLLGLLIWEAFLVALHLFARSAPLLPLLGVAVPELLLSLVFLLPLYPLLRAVWRKVGGTRLSD